MVGAWEGLYLGSIPNYFLCFGMHPKIIDLYPKLIPKGGVVQFFLWRRHPGPPLSPLVLCNLDRLLSPHPKAYLVDQRFRPNFPIVDPVIDVLQTFVKCNCILVSKAKSQICNLILCIDLY